MEVKLGEVIKIKHGFAFKGEFFTNKETGLAVLTPGNFTLTGGFQETEKFYDSADFPEEYILSSGDLIVTMTDLSKEADTIGYAALVPENKNHKYLHNQRIGLVTVYNPDFEKDYIYWLMRSSHYQRTIANSSNGATVHHTSPDKIYKYRFEKKPLVIQKKIAFVLSQYDSLLENNNKRIKVLEQIAENLYKEWFVRFRFPGHENAEFENGIPKGWLRGRIDSYYDTTSGGTPSRKNEEFYNNGVIPWVKTGEIKDSIILDTEEHITKFAINKSSAKILPKGCVIMAMYGVNIGMLSYLSKEMSCNQACCAFTDKRNFSSRHYLFHYMKSIREYLLLIGFGAAQQNLSQDLIKRIRITMPSDELVKNFEQQINVYYNQISNLLKQNRNLIKQRDLLLPRLMSGKLEV